MEDVLYLVRPIGSQTQGKLVTTLEAAMKLLQQDDEIVKWRCPTVSFDVPAGCQN